MTAVLSVLTNALGTVHAYSAAVRLGVLDRIDREPGTAAEVAQACGLNGHGTALLLASLETTGLVDRLPDGRYQPIVPGLAGLHPMLAMWDNLSDVVRNGNPVLNLDKPEQAASFYPQLVTALGAAHESTALHLAQNLPAANRVLDVGAGASPWSIALAARDRVCKVTAMDLPAVLNTTRRATNRAGVADQFDYLPGDVFEIDLPVAAYDLVLVAHVCHLFDPDTVGSLLGRLRPAVAPSGALTVVDIVPGGRARHCMNWVFTCARTAVRITHPTDTADGWPPTDSPSPSRSFWTATLRCS
ncbi:class I SAM-dependent methyltransferase [Fodinicola feengrottensis]|uniref:class I SAM-dependent methyltransferase n=1 Tax=Fodinicola feengrottensis TaxID=435914 RepID=UPI0013D1C0E0|nr:class I SAM-dependent methyltransferase [Fodinicola feengrottensis]